MKPAPLRVAYVLRAFPRLSETFILNEILALRRRGIDLRIVAVEEAREPRRHPAAARLLPEVTWVPPAALRANGRVACRGAAPPEKQLRFWTAGAWLGRRLSRWGAQHIHAHFAGPAATLAARAAECSGLPFTFTAHAKDIFARSVDWRWVSELARRAEAVVTVCDYNHDYLRRRLPRGTRVARVYNGVDLREWRPAPRRAARAHIVAVGRLVRKKGFHVLVDAAALLAAWNVEARVTLVGDGAERAALEAQVRARGLAGRVRLAGPLPQPEVRRLMRGARAVTLPCIVAPDGNQDALPTVLLEAGACGVPVVASRLAGVPEIVRHGRTGLLTPPGDAHALARALRRLLESPELAARLGRNARAWVAERFDQRDAAARLHALFAGAAPQHFQEGAHHAYHAALP